MGAPQEEIICLEEVLRLLTLCFLEVIPLSKSTALLIRAVDFFLDPRSEPSLDLYRFTYVIALELLSLEATFCPDHFSHDITSWSHLFIRGTFQVLRSGKPIFLAPFDSFCFKLVPLEEPKKPSFLRFGTLVAIPLYDELASALPPSTV